MLMRLYDWEPIRLGFKQCSNVSHVERSLTQINSGLNAYVSLCLGAPHALLPLCNFWWLQAVW